MVVVVPRFCACASHGPSGQYPKPLDQLFSSTPLNGNAKSRTMALLLPEELKKIHFGSVKAFACSSTDAIQLKENLYSSSSYEESTSGSTQIGLLMENLNEIEEILCGTELEQLEREILLQIKRLGALNLFHEGLARNLALTPSLESDFLQLEVPLEKPKDNVPVIRSGRSQERKMKRIKASHKRATETKPFSSKTQSNSKKFQKRHQRIISFGWRSINHTAKEELEFAEGVKVASNLERIREALEKETGQPVGSADWAKAAGIDRGMLSQQLVHGSYCRDQLVECTRPLVIHLVKKFIGMGIDPEDLLQAGYWGVLKGAEKFDSKKGFKFSTYIRYWIRKAIFELIAQHSRIFRMSVRAESMVQKIQKAKKELRFHLGRYPRDEELAKFTGFPLASVRLARRCSRSVSSFDQYVGHELNIKLKEIIPDKSVEEKSSSTYKSQLKEVLLLILEELSPREKQIIVQRYGLDDGACKSLEEVGKSLCLTKEWIRKVEKDAITKLRRDDVKNNLRRLLNW